MIGSIIVCMGGPDGDRSTRGTIAGRSPLLAAQHSNSGERVSRAICGPVILRRRGCRQTGSFRFLRTQVRHPFNSSRPIRLPGSLIPIGFHRALTVCQDARRDSADPFHFSPSAAKRGLAVVFNGREDDRKKSKCPTNVFPGAEKIFPKRV